MKLNFIFNFFGLNRICAVFMLYLQIFSEMRLECDEVMAPEHRCVVSPRSSGAISPLPVQIKRVLHTSDVPPRKCQPLTGCRSIF